MYKDIKFFHAEFEIDAQDLNLLKQCKIVLNNVKAYSIRILNAQHINNYEEAIAQQILDAIKKRQQCSFIIEKNGKHANVLFYGGSIKLYLEPPLVKHLHVDEIEASTDYLAYLDLLLDLLANLPVLVIECNHKLDNH